MRVRDDWVVLLPWFSVEDEFTSVDDWLAVAELLVVLLPLPTFTPGLIVAPAFTSELDTPTFAFRSRFGFTFNVAPEVVELDGEVELEVLPVDGSVLLPVEDDVPEPEMVPLVVPEVVPVVLPELVPVELPELVPVLEPEPMPVPEPIVPVVDEPVPVAPFSAPPAALLVAVPELVVPVVPAVAESS